MAQGRTFQSNSNLFQNRTRNRVPSGILLTLKIFYMSLQCDRTCRGLARRTDTVHVLATCCYLLGKARHLPQTFKDESSKMGTGNVNSENRCK
jgi:hypothetical protein